MAVLECAQPLCISHARVITSSRHRDRVRLILGGGRGSGMGKSWANEMSKWGKRSHQKMTGVMHRKEGARVMDQYARYGSKVDVLE